MMMALCVPAALFRYSQEVHILFPRAWYTHGPVRLVAFRHGLLQYGICWHSTLLNK
jgi:hypothetical protein